MLLISVCKLASHKSNLANLHQESRIPLYSCATARLERHAYLRGNPRDYGGIKRILHLFSRVSTAESRVVAER